MSGARWSLAPGMLACAVMLGAATGCSTSKKAASTSATGGSQATTTSGAATTSPAPTTSTLPAKSKLLSLNELPDGWAIDKSNDSSGDSPIKCVNKLGRTAENGSTSHGEVKFVKGTDLPLADELVANYDQGGASATINSVSSRLDSCGSFKYTDSGTDVSGQIAPMNFSVAGLTDQHAYQLTIQASLGSAGGVYLLGRKGETVMLFAYADTGSPDLEAIRPIVNSAVAKLG